jgi:antitoxin (DNA-binding transcriptional repressor) of toxin-antitoxin stability system
MKFVTVRDLRAKSGEVWKTLLSEKDLVLTNNGKPIALLSTITEENIEKSLAAVRRARALDAMEQMQTQAMARGLDRMTQAEINAEIAEARKARKK